MTIRRTKGAVAILLTLVCFATNLAPASWSRARSAQSAPAPSMAPRSHTAHASASATRLFRSSARRAAATAEATDGPREIPSLRTRTSDTYVGSNGVYTVHQSVAESINYQDATGAWQPISNTLIPARSDLAAAGFAYQNTANAYTVAFAATSGGTALERIAYHGATLDIAPVSARTPTTTASATATLTGSAAPTRTAPGTAAVTGSALQAQTPITGSAPQVVTARVASNVITYPGVFPATDMQYVVRNGEVKEALFLHDASAPTAFTFALHTNGLRPMSVARGAGLRFMDAAGQAAFTLAPLVATDAHGATTPVSLTFSPVAGAVQIQIVIPPAWLADPARAWPVTLDPTVVLSPALDVNIAADNQVHNFAIYCQPPLTPPDCPYGANPNAPAPYNTYGREPVDAVGLNNTVSQLPESTFRSLLLFDLSPLPPHITLLNATLRAAMGPPSTSNVGQTQNAAAYPVTASWNYNANWQTRDGATPWATPGGDYDAQSGVSAPLSFSHSATSDGVVGADDVSAYWNLTELVRQWYLGTRPNDGLLVKMADESVPSFHVLDWEGVAVTYSYIPWQGGAAPGGERAFDPHAALKSDRALITFPQGDGQQMGVNIANGDLEIMRNDLSIPSLGLPDVIQRTFHSAASPSAATSLGHQWQLSVGGDTALYPQPSGDVIYVDPTGQGYDLPSTASAAASTIVTNTTTQGAYQGTFGNDGAMLNGWQNGLDFNLWSYQPCLDGYRRPQGTTHVWQLGTTDPRGVLFGAQRNATALVGITQTEQILSCTTPAVITASVYLVNWGAPYTSTGEMVQVQDALGIHDYHAANYDNGLWVSFTNLVIGPTQPITVLVTADSGTNASSSALTIDSHAPGGWGWQRAPGLAADLAQNADGSYTLTYNGGLADLFSSSGQYIGARDRHGNTEHFGYGGGTGGSCGATMIGVITDTVGRATTMDCSGSLITSISDADNRAVRYGYDANNNLTSFTDRAGGVTQYQYNAAGQLITITDPIRNQTVITYNAAQQVNAVQDGAGSVTTFSYGITGTNTTTVTNALNESTVYTLDPATGEILSVTDPNGQTTRSTYDSNSLLLTTTDPLGHVITNTTTVSGDETSSTSPLGDSSSSSYNALHEPTVVTDTQGYTTTTQYNAVGDPLTVTDPLRNTTLYTYTSRGLRTAMSDGNQHTTESGYDAFGDTVAITDALNRVSTMAYDTNISRLTSATDPKHQTTQFSYDNEDRPTQTTYQDGASTKNYLDADGNITETVDSKGGVTLFRYDGDNRVTQKTYPDGTVVQYSYDAAGHLASKSEPGLPLTSYSYDPAGNLITVTNSLFGPIIYHYDEANRLTSLSYPNGVTTAYSDDADNRLIALTETLTGTTLLGDAFSYAKPGGGTWGLRSSETLTDTSGSATWNYGYDADNQITAAGPISYTFDGNGNQTGTSASLHPLWTYDARNHTSNYTDTLTQDSFLTGADNQRQQKTTTQGGTTTSGVFDGDMYRETAPVSRTLYYISHPGGRLLAVTDGTTVYYYGLDGHGSVNNLTDSHGTVVNRYSYDPYGNSLSKSETASIPNPWQYAGGYYDAESGIYLLGVRYYDPKLGRFLQQDPLGGGSDSQYAYAGSNPCNNSDPTGMMTCYHFVSQHDLKQSIANLQQEIGTNNVVGGGSAAGGVVGVVGKVVLGGIFLIIGGLTQAINVKLQSELDAYTPYATTKPGVWVKYTNTSIFGFGGDCDSSYAGVKDPIDPTGPGPVVSGWQWDLLRYGNQPG